MAIHGRDPALLRRINAAAILRLLHEQESMTLTEVVAGTGLSRRTAEAVLASLGGEALVECREAANGSRSVGRPPRTFRFRHEAGVCLGVVVELEQIRTVLADLAGEVLATGSTPVAREATRRERLAAIVEGSRATLARARVPRKRLRSVAVGTPGLVGPDGRITQCDLVPGWQDLDLGTELGRWMRCPVLVENDVNLAAQGERWRGAAQGRGSLVWVLTGARTRAAIVIDGRLYRGADGAAGEIGRLPVLGWAEVERHSLAYLRAHSGAGQAGDLPAARDGLARALARGLAALVLTVNPQCLVLAGVCAADEDAAADDALARAVREHLGPLCVRPPEVRVSTLAGEGMVLGALRVALDDVQHRLFSVG